MRRSACRQAATTSASASSNQRQNTPTRRPASGATSRGSSRGGTRTGAGRNACASVPADAKCSTMQKPLHLHKGSLQDVEPMRRVSTGWGAWPLVPANTDDLRYDSGDHCNHKPILGLNRCGNLNG